MLTHNLSEDTYKLVIHWQMKRGVKEGHNFRRFVFINFVKTNLTECPKTTHFLRGFLLLDKIPSNPYETMKFNVFPQYAVCWVGLYRKLFVSDKQTVS